MYPFFEDTLLADIHNLALSKFVDYIDKLKPATIRDYINIVKAVVASAIDKRVSPYSRGLGKRTS
jgi:hypothetical protein